MVSVFLANDENKAANLTPRSLSGIGQVLPTPNPGRARRHKHWLPSTAVAWKFIVCTKVMHVVEDEIVLRI